jgi:hypothetical protein
MTTAVAHGPLDLDDVARLAAELPGVGGAQRRGTRTWSVGTRCFAWERPYTKADIKRFGDETPPEQPVLALRVADLGEKEAILAHGRPGVFTMAHFDGYAAVLVELPATTEPVLADLLVDAYLALAPAELASAYLARIGAG